MAAILEDVDICVTCISDNPPQLPLRQELPSLGVEVVYRSKGHGMKASQHEAREKVQQYRIQEATYDMTRRNVFGIRGNDHGLITAHNDMEHNKAAPTLHKNSTCSTSSTSLFGPNLKHIRAKLAERKRMERLLKTPHALTYESYSSLRNHHHNHQHGLDGEASSETNPTSCTKPQQQYHATCPNTNMETEEAKQEKDEFRNVESLGHERRESPPTPDIRKQQINYDQNDELEKERQTQRFYDMNEDGDDQEVRKINSFPSTCPLPSSTVSLNEYRSENHPQPYEMKRAVTLTPSQPTPPPSQHQHELSRQRVYAPGASTPTNVECLSLRELLANGKYQQSKPKPKQVEQDQTHSNHQKQSKKKESKTDSSKNKKINSAADAYERFERMAEEFLCPAFPTEEEMRRSKENFGVNQWRNNSKCKDGKPSMNKQKERGKNDEMIDLLHVAASTLTSFGSWCSPAPVQVVDSPTHRTTSQHFHNPEVLHPVIKSQQSSIPDGRDTTESAVEDGNPDFLSHCNDTNDSSNGVGISQDVIPVVTHLPPPPPSYQNLGPQQQQLQKPDQEAQRETQTPSKPDAAEKADAALPQTFSSHSYHATSQGKHIQRLQPQYHAKERHTVPPWLSSVASSPLFLAAKERQKQHLEIERSGRLGIKPCQMDDVSQSRVTGDFSHAAWCAEKKQPQPMSHSQEPHTLEIISTATSRQNMSCRRSTHEKELDDSKNADVPHSKITDYSKTMEKKPSIDSKNAWGIEGSVMSKIKRREAKYELSPRNRDILRYKEEKRKSACHSNDQKTKGRISDEDCEMEMHTEYHANNKISSISSNDLSVSQLESDPIVVENPNEEKKELHASEENQKTTDLKSPKKLLQSSTATTPKNVVRRNTVVDPHAAPKIVNVSIYGESNQTRGKQTLRDLLARDTAVRASPSTPNTLPSPPTLSRSWEHQQGESRSWEHQQGEVQAPILKSKQTPTTDPGQLFSTPSASNADCSPYQSTAAQSTPRSGKIAFQKTNSSSWITQRHDKNGSMAVGNERDEKVTPSSPASMMKGRYHGLAYDQKPQPSPRTIQLAIPTLQPHDDPRRETKSTQSDFALTRPINNDGSLERRNVGNFESHQIIEMKNLPNDEPRKTAVSMLQRPACPPISPRYAGENIYNKAKILQPLKEMDYHDGDRAKLWTPTQSPTPTAMTTPDGESCAENSVNSKRKDEPEENLIVPSSVGQKDTTPTKDDKTRPSTGKVASSRPSGRVARMVELYSKGKSQDQ